jgi:DNA-binding NarL/FixJ family response regulator
LLTPSITRRLITRYAQQPADLSLVPTVAGLTDRETEVLALVARGLSNDEVAAHLHLSPATVKTHVSRAMTKLGAHDRAQLVIAAYEYGVAQPRRRDLVE